MGANRSRKPVRFTTVLDPLSGSFTLPMNMTLIQYVITFSTAPQTLGQNFRIYRDSDVAAVYDFDVLNEDLSITGTLTELVASGRWEMGVRDVVRVVYPNPDERTIGVELLFEEAQ